MIPISQLVVIIKNGTPFTMFDRETLFYIMEYQFVLVLSECNIKKFFGVLNVFVNVIIIDFYTSIYVCLYILVRNNQKTL